MRYYVYKVREVYESTYEVEADSEAEALDLVEEGEGCLIQGYLVSEFIDKDDWEVEEIHAEE
jgi:hypothetical protein